MARLLGEILYQLRGRVAAQTGNVDRTEQQQFEQLLDQGPIIRLDGFLQPTVGHIPSARFHELTQQIRFGALQDLDVNALGH